MANTNVPFSGLPVAVGALTGAEILPADQGGTTKQVTAGQIAALAGVGQLLSGFLLSSASPILTNSRTFAVQPTLSITDGGPGSTFTIGTAPITGDVTAASNSFVTTVAKINGVPLGTTTATSGNILIGQGSSWVSVTMNGDVTLTASGFASVNSLHSGAFANPTGTVGLAAVNGVAITAMRSDAAPPLSQAISPTWTGNHKFNPTAGVALSASGPSGLSRTIDIQTQYSGTITSGNQQINQIAINDSAILGANTANGVNISHIYGSSTSMGNRQALQVGLTLAAPTASSGTLRFYVGAQIAAQANTGDGGGAGTEKGQIIALNPAVTLSSLATHLNEMSAIEITLQANNGASVLQRSGIEISDISTAGGVQGSQFDAAIVMGNAPNGAPFVQGLRFDSTFFGSAPIASSGTYIAAAGTQTVNKFIDFSTAVASSLAIDFGVGIFQMDGAGNILRVGNVNMAAATILSWNGRSLIYSTANGLVAMTNNAGTDFTTLLFGPSSNQHTAISVSGSTLSFRLADNSGDASITAGAITGSSNATIANMLNLTSSIDSGLTLKNAAGNQYTALHSGTGHYTLINAPSTNTGAGVPFFQARDADNGALDANFGYLDNDTLLITNRANTQENMRVTSTNGVTLFSTFSVPAGGSSNNGIRFVSGANPGMYFGSGAPTLIAGQGSFYFRTDGGSSITRAYINSSGSSVWQAILTAA